MKKNITNTIKNDSDIQEDNSENIPEDDSIDALDEPKSIDEKNEDEEKMSEILEKHTKQGCGNCPQVEGQCFTCTENLCNTESFYRKEFYACRTFDDKYVICAPGSQKCYYGVKPGGGLAGCGNCPLEDLNCFDCSPINCNTWDNLDKAFRCFASKGKFTATNARE
uniref:Uncharacterized protein n=1 Tax=Meloidogyne floridensis TaxID=298350 RepID=A0A915PDT4_9BILA